MQLKSNRSFSKRGGIDAKFVLSFSFAVSLLAPSLIPQAFAASRSQPTNTSPSSDASNIAAAAAASLSRTPAAGDGISPSAEPPEQSSDRGFSTEDFLHPDDGKRKTKTAPTHIGALMTPASKKANEDAANFNLRVRVSVPQNKNAVDQFVAYPYPMPLPVPKRPPGTKGQSSGDPENKPPIPRQAYDKMPSTRQTLRDLIMQTGYSNRTKRDVAYPAGGWRWQMAYRNALKKSHRDEPLLITEMYPFIDAMEPIVKAECEKFDDLEEERQRRYETAYEEYQLNRSEYEYKAVKKGYYPVEFNLTKGWRGQLSGAEIRLGQGTWWLTGTHKVAGLTYYWQMPVQVANGNVEDVELDWQNALVIEGGW